MNSNDTLSFSNDIFSLSKLENLVRSQDWLYENAAMDWRDGMLLGGGSLGVIAYAPGPMEWVINKLDVFDPRLPQARFTPHDKVMRYFHDTNQKNVHFLEEWEKPDETFSVNSISALILRLHFGNGELGWNAPAFPAVSQRLCLYEGELYSNINAHLIHSRTKSFTPHGQNLFVFRIEGCAISDWEHTIEVCRPYHDDMDLPVWHIDDNLLCFEQVLPGGIGKYAMALYVVNRPPDISRVNYQMPPCFEYEKRKNYILPTQTSDYYAKVQQAGDMDLFIAVCSSYEYADPLKAAKDEVYQAAEKGFEKLESEHRKWWSDYWQHSAADFGIHNEIQRYWYFSLYEIGCAYGKAPMPALNGLVYGPLNANNPGVGSPHYFHDQNVQIPVMPFGVLNHTELIYPLVDTYLNAYDELRKHTRFLFQKTGGDGIFLPLVANQLGKERASYSYRYTLCGSAYTGLMLCWMWKYKRDINMLRDKLFPLLCELIRFYTNNLLEFGPDEKYHLDWSIPPEIFTLTRDDTATLAMLKTCLQTAVEASELLWMNQDEAKKWQHILDHYPDLAKHDEGGWWGGPDIHPHHYCFGAHLLYPFFPSEAYISPEDQETTRKTITYIEKYAIERSYADTDGQWHHNHDWSWLLTTVTRFRLGDKERAWKELNRFLLHFAKPNGLFSHNPVIILPAEVTEDNLKFIPSIQGNKVDPITSPSWYIDGKCATPNPNAKRLVSPVLEGNSAFLFCASETLLQSFDGKIKLFPGVPDDFSGKFYRFLAQGGFEVSAVMEKGKVVFVQIHSLIGGHVKIYNPWGDQCPSKEVILQMEDGAAILSTYMQPGQVLILKAPI